MINHNTSIEILKNNIQDIKNRIKFLNDGDAFEFYKEAKTAELKSIDDIEGTIAQLTSFTSKPLELKSNALRVKLIKNNETINIHTIEKEGKKYAVVPIELLPKIISF